ncbi:hypothetical protein VISI1226_04220 [Vibrio sinaloensis DSM 21326]|uniref:Uncharacterized protein n=1 Tax=Vibrio sinaloensis DSM 21326 TaxID=945550 RepID=E8M6Z3_PHOS4|nr:hypothetical protein VISI1226_04220 [Vibrio sinaloensis DSM 21326]
MRNLRASMMTTRLYTSVAMDAKGCLPINFTLLAKLQSLRRATFYALPAVIAVVDRMRVVAADTGEIAPLQKDDQAVAWPINARKRQDATD